MASRIKVTDITTLTGTGSVNIEVGLGVTGDLNFSGNLLKNGLPFASLPEQSVQTMGAMLMSDGQSVFLGTPNNI